MLKTTVMIPEDLKDLAQRYAEQHGISLSDLIREALRERLRQDAVSSRTADSLFADQAVYEEDAPKDLTARHDDYLYDDPVS